MAMNKKAVFFSITSLLVVGVLFVIVQTDANTRDTGYVQLQLQNFQDDNAKITEQHLPQLLIGYTRETINTIAKENYRLLQEEEPTINVLDALEECVMSLDPRSYCYNSVTTSSTKTFQEALRDYEERLREQKLDTQIELTNFRVSQLGPWDLIAIAEFDVETNESQGNIRYQRPVTVQAQIPVAGLIDPVSSYYRASPHQIRRTTILNTSELFAQHVQQGTYILNPDAPSYLDRLSGKMSQDSDTPQAYGISSLIPATSQYATDFGNREIDEEDCTQIDVKFTLSGSEETIEQEVTLFLPREEFQKYSIAGKQGIEITTC